MNHLTESSSKIVVPENSSSQLSRSISREGLYAKFVADTSKLECPGMLSADERKADSVKLKAKASRNFEEAEQKVRIENL